MKISELVNEPEIVWFKAALESKNLNYEDAVFTAYEKFESSKQQLKSATDSDLIAFVVKALLELINANVKPKRNGWKIFWNIVTLGIPLLFKKKEGE